MPPTTSKPYIPPIITQSPIEIPLVKSPEPKVPSTACPRCSDVFKPVCAFNDGQEKTFNNECLMLTENCYSNTSKFEPCFLLHISSLINKIGLNLESCGTPVGLWYL